MQSTSGELPANQWIKAVWGWGYYAIDYGVNVSVSCDYRCYVGVFPIAWSAGTFQSGQENHVTHRVIVYGDVWLRGRNTGRYALIPIGPPSPLSAVLRAKLSTRFPTDPAAQT